MTPRDEIRRKQLESHAEGYLELGMAQHALDALNRLGDLSELTPRTLYLRGEALRTLERYQEALEPLHLASFGSAEDIQVWLALGWCHKRTGRIDLAIKALERALEVEPSEALIHYNLACYLSLAGNKPRALSHLSQALAIDPDYRMLTHDESDFDSIRSDPEFVALTSIIV